MEPSLIIVFAVVLVLGGVVLSMVTFGKGGRKFLNKDKYRGRWLEIESSVDHSDENTLHLAVLNADKLLDQALKERGFAGNTMAERLKSAGSNWSNRDQLRLAHRLRNKVVHETDVKLSPQVAKKALSSFKQALKDLGAI